jgi:hypothetical protein
MKKSYVTLIISSLILFIAGLYTYGLFFQFVLPKDGSLIVLNNSLNEHFKNHIFYSIILGLIPISIYLTWKFCEIRSNKNRIITTLIILFFIVSALLINLYLMHLASNFVISDKILNTVTVDSFKFIQYMLGGLIFGMLISLIIFRPKINKVK